MNDLISRNAALAALHELHMQEVDKHPSVYTGISQTFCVVRDAPAIDAVPVVHAEWKDHCCTNCFATCVTARSPQGWVYNIETRYCPNCGARMDGEADG